MEMLKTPGLALGIAAYVVPTLAIAAPCGAWRYSPPTMRRWGSIATT